MATNAKTQTPPTPAPLAVQLRELLSKATKDDVDQIDAQIAEKEKELDALRSDRKMVAQAAGIEEPKKVHWTQKRRAANANGTVTDGVTKIASSDIPARRRKVLEFLKANGSKSQQALSEQTGINRQGPGNLANVLAYEWFHVSPEGLVSLTDKGDRAAA